MSRPRVLLADDHPSMLERTIRLVAEEFDIVSAANNGRAALDAAVVLQPDVVVLDISMPVMSGLEAAARISELAHPPRIVFLTVHDDPAFVEAAREAGATAYVLKPNIATDLIPAIRLALEGRTQFPAATANADVTAH
jgi:DNA-binding NarL/FixJ family response regulator